MGYVIVKAGLLKGEDSKVISKIVLYLIIPCVIINAFQVDYTSEKVRAFAGLCSLCYAAGGITCHCVDSRPSDGLK